MTEAATDAGRFHELADAALAELEAAIEAWAIETWDETGTCDVELLGGILSVVAANGREFVINKHEPTRQIWFASPVSGAGRFVYNDAREKWMHAVTGRELQDMVISELSDMAEK